MTNHPYTLRPLSYADKASFEGLSKGFRSRKSVLHAENKAANNKLYIIFFICIIYQKVMFKPNS